MANSAFKILPKNYLADWGSMESWSQGTGSAPDGWLVATAANIQRESTNKKFGTYGALVSGSNGGNGGGLYRTIPNGVDHQGKTFKYGVWAKSASTGPYIEINDGVTSKTVHLDGLNAMYFLTLPPHKMDYAGTQLMIGLWASLSATVYFDEAVLVEGEDLFTDLSTGNVLIEDWSPTVNLKQDQYEIAGREGSLIPDNHAKSNDIRLRGTVVGTDVVSCRTNFDTLMKSLLSWKTNEKRDLFLYDDRVREVYLKGFDWTYLNSLQFIKFNMSISSPDASARSLGKLRSRTIISGTVTEFNLTYNGNFESKPVFQFIANQAATITTCVLENLTTNETFAYTGTVPTNISLEIDSNEGTIANSSADSIVNFSGDFIKLVRGTNYFRFSGSNCQINIDYYERYL